jgi:CBS domain-containing protein
MRLSDILRVKGSMVVTIEPDRTVLDAVRTLVDHNIGAVVVVEDGAPVGILSERDILRLTSKGPEQLDGILIADVMTREVVFAGESDSLPDAMETMTLHRIRHLPVTRGEALAGIVSIGDVVNALRSEFEQENQHLKKYISGAG